MATRALDALALCYFPNVYDAKWFTSPTDGETYLLASERGSGLYVLKLDASIAPMLG